MVNVIIFINLEPLETISNAQELGNISFFVLPFMPQLELPIQIQDLSKTEQYPEGHRKYNYII